MDSGLSRAISPAEIDTYRQDGIVCLRGLFEPDWVDYLRELVDADIQAPSSMVKNINQQGSTGFFFGDTFVRQHLPGFDRFVRQSPAAEIAGSLMQSAKVNLIFDQILVKEPGASTPTLWHQDAPYWPVAGGMIATLWLALDPVTLDNGAVEYIRGSHHGGTRYRAVSFDPDEHYQEDLPAVPDIAAEREKYDIVSFEMAPGDCTVHHGLTVHGAPGNRSSEIRRRAYVTRWAGDDVTYNPRPNLQRMLSDPGIALGGPLDCELFPVVWRRPPPA
ncbi:MAG: phytanoyl-CoA dioxygenase family protein [Alphaproteobacteria bacterium]|jgi:ectoine hydroxylase-related dioxygenase (phytanoyl-CoA dioxygenase family)|nr:phytanoyl-CoA dioxygenase family protein [Alphaproteobacteria bacterium]MDP6566323.1 phytanoyl-CoA dioxygenase family protein [Alphaproteobacteria bacterium]MDP6815414.1 phytanoyl-CoA dioxygenase family protein [Alphaproteobacteria bacterium]